jgi:hypothetical protein
MVLQLNNDLAIAIDQQGETPVQAIHPVTGKVFFLVSEEQYRRLKPLFEAEPLTLGEQRLQLQQAGKRAGWDGPTMDAYDRYDDYRK